MYERCLGKNPNLQSCRLQPIDNRAKNEGIPVCYNRTLEELNDGEDRWLVFCHEDFQFLEPLAPWFDRMDKNAIYGPIGGSMSMRRHWLFGELWSGSFQGVITESEKNGDDAKETGCRVPFDTSAETVDCQCVIVHASLVEKFNLRFDERLSFDLYAEDFCMNAFLANGIPTRILPLRCQHYSRGTIAPRFFEQLTYLDQKYPRYEVFGSVGHMIGGGRTKLRRFQKKSRHLLDLMFPWLSQMLLKLS